MGPSNRSWQIDELVSADEATSYRRMTHACQHWYVRDGLQTISRHPNVQLLWCIPRVDTKPPSSTSHGKQCEYISESLANEWKFSRHTRTNSASSDVYMMNKRGPKTEPCSTEQSRWTINGMSLPDRCVERRRQIEQPQSRDLVCRLQAASHYRPPTPRSQY